MQNSRTVIYIEIIRFDFGGKGIAENWSGRLECCLQLLEYFAARLLPRSLVLPSSDIRTS